MRAMSMAQVAALAGGRLPGNVAARQVTGVSTDTRNLQAGDLFVALSGDHFDGHDFVCQAAQQGAVGALVEKSSAAWNLPADFALLEVPNSLAALQLLAKNYRQTLQVNIVAVTGSNGKTSTKEFVAAVLAQRFRVHKTSGNLNNHIGVPLTILGLNAEHEYGVIEMGMNHPGELQPLVDIAKPDIGIITNVGWAHIEAFANRHEIAKEKLRVIEGLGSHGLAIIDDNAELAQMAKSLCRARIIQVGSRDDCQYRIEPLQFSAETTQFKFCSAKAEAVIELPVAGWHMARNAAMAAALGMELGLELAVVVAALRQVSLPKNRLQVRRFRQGYLLDDTYNASPDSMLAAFQTLAKFPGEGRNVALLGSMGELGAYAQQLHREAGAAAVREGFNLLLAYGPYAGELVAGAVSEGLSREAAGTFQEHAALAAAYWRQARANDRILVKGSRTQRMELVVRELEQLEMKCCTI